jgi:hypothetical protein
MRKDLMAFTPVLFLTALFVVPMNTLIVNADAQSSATVFLDPSSIRADVIGETIIVNVNVSNVVNLFGWQAGVTFNPEVLNCVDYREGEFLNRSATRSVNPSNGTVWCGVLRQPRWNNSEGIVYYHGCSVLGPVPGVDGSGQLGYLVFKVVGIGVSDLHLTDVVLVNPKVEDIQHEVVDTFTVSSGEVDYSVEAMSNLTGVLNPPHPPSSGLFNHAFSPYAKTVSFDVMADYDNFLNVTVPLELMGSDLRVLIDDVPTSFSLTKNETHASLYFTHGHSTHSIKIAGATANTALDLNGDGHVNVLDIAIVARAFGAVQSDSRWNVTADVNHDSKINIIDVSIVARAVSTLV